MDNTSVTRRVRFDGVRRVVASKTAAWISIIGLLAFGCHSMGSNESFDRPVDEEIVRHLDLTGDGSPEVLILHLRADSFDSPFTWSLTIRRKSETIFEIAGNDSAKDNFFGDPEYVGGCSDYATCKRRWYYEMLPDIVVPPSAYNLEGILDRRQDNTLYPLAGRFLEEKCFIAGTDAERILANMERRLRSGDAVAIAICDPMTCGELMIFAPEVNRFVPIYQD